MASDLLPCDAVAPFTGVTSDDLVVYTIKVIQQYYVCSDRQIALTKQFK